MDTPDFSNLKAIYVDCTHKKSPEKNTTTKLMNLSQHIMLAEGVQVDILRFTDYTVPFGIFPDMTAHQEPIDEWPTLFKRIIEADILIIGTPITLGVKSSVVQKLTERMYAMKDVTDRKGRSVFRDKVAGCAITGKDQGISHCAINILHTIQRIGYAIPPQSYRHWIEKTMTESHTLNVAHYVEEDNYINKNATFMTYNLLHLTNSIKIKAASSRFEISSDSKISVNFGI